MLRRGIIALVAAVVGLGMTAPVSGAVEFGFVPDSFEAKLVDPTSLTGHSGGRTGEL